MKIMRTCLCLLIVMVAFLQAFPQEEPSLIGDLEKTYTLAEENQEVRGLAFDDISPYAPRLLVLDKSGKIFAYRYQFLPKKGIDQLELEKVYEIAPNEKNQKFKSLRGLACTLDGGDKIIYALDWEKSGESIRSYLWRYNMDKDSSSSIDLSLYPFCIGDREVYSLTYNNGRLYISFDNSGYLSHNKRMRRGIIKLKWAQDYERQLEFVKHMPDSGEGPCRGLAFMEFGEGRYLWGTVGHDYIYSADAETGRGLFYFDMPQSEHNEEEPACWDIAYGHEALWVPGCVPGPDLIYRVNVTKNLEAPWEGPHMLRHLIMKIETHPEREISDPGEVYHYYSRPYTYSQIGKQSIWLDTEKIMDLSDVANASIRHFTYHPADDESSPQHMWEVEYANAPARSYSSQYEMDIWTSSYRKYVYPHQVDKNTQKLEGTHYLEDDPTLFNLDDTDTYDHFFQRVKTYIEEEYGVPADMENPYWAARNIVEYIQDHYYYPSRPKRKPAAVDYENDHYDANPGNLKIDLSREEYNKNQIIACSGTSVMVCGAMRYLGFPARWLGTGREKGPEVWDTNDNGLLDEDEIAPCSSGHRYNQVWLGSLYGWVCFDATPSRPPYNDFDPIPPKQSQWRFMQRAAGGHRRAKHIVFNVGSKLFRPLYRDFEYDEELAVDNNCGGDQRYNFQGRFEKPEYWELARHRILARNLCFIQDVQMTGPTQNKKISWTLKGEWQKDPRALLTIYLQEYDPDKETYFNKSVLKKKIPYQTSSVQADLSPFKGQKYRIMIRKHGDPETGGHSESFFL